MLRVKELNYNLCCSDEEQITSYVSLLAVFLCFRGYFCNLKQLWS